MKKFVKAEDIIPANDVERLKKLRKYHILDTPSEVIFDTIAQIAKDVFGTDGAFVSFVDEDRVFFKSNLSTLDSSHADRNDSLCSYSILDDGLTIIQDTHQVEGLSDLSVVAAKDGIRFYAAAPILTAEGYNIGTVCVTDNKPRIPDELHLKVLKNLAVLTLEKLETRMLNRIAVQAYDDRIERLAHDMKNPATSLIAYGQLLGKQSLKAEKLVDFGNKIEGIGRQISSTMNNIMSEAGNENAAIRLKVEQVSVNELLSHVARTFELSLAAKKQQLEISCQSDHIVQVDRGRIEDAMANLMSNAVKYSYQGGKIRISCYEENKQVVIRINDEGVGMTPDDIEKLFTKFAKLSSVATANERSNGIGLYIVKMLIGLHGGKVWATSPGKEKGSTFYMSLPVYQI